MAFRSRLFSSQEQRQNSDTQLVSIFCLKEAIIKALLIPQNSWLKISTDRKMSGKVGCSFTDKKIAEKIITLDSSISHDGGWIIAVVVAILKTK